MLLDTPAHILPKNKKRHLLIACVFILFAGLIVALSPVGNWVGAQLAGQALEVSPPSQEINVDPGSTIKVQTKIRNRSNTPLPIKVHIEDFTASGDEGQVALSSGSPWSVLAWTSVTPEQFTLAPGEVRSVNATIKVPTDAAGGRYGSFVFGVDSEEKGGNTALSQQIASLFLVRISGPVDESLLLNSLSAPAFSEFGPIPLSLNFQNAGNVHVKTYGLINVTDVFGNRVADVVVSGTNVFPKASRIITAPLQKTFLIGPYTATAIMYYGTIKNDTLMAKTTFFVFPARVAIGVCIVLFLIYILRRRLSKAFSALFR